MIRKMELIMMLQTQQGTGTCPLVAMAKEDLNCSCDGMQKEARTDHVDRMT